MKVFLDIGAHVGETLSVVTDARWGFDRIVCFEPAPSCWPAIRRRADERVELCEFGLWDKDESLKLHNAGAIGASLSAAKDAIISVETCDFRDAAAWFALHVDFEDIVYAKINAEGAEVNIVDRLAAAGQLSKIDHLLIHFDVRKVPDMAHREGEARQQLKAAEVAYQSADEIQFGGVYRGTVNWLRWVHGDPRTRDVRYKHIARASHAVRRFLYPLKAGRRTMLRSNA